MDVCFGFVGNGFTLLVSDTSRVQSIVVQRTEVDKILQLDSHKLMATTGEPGDACAFSELIKANLQLYTFRNGHSLSTHAAANYTRTELAKALRRGPYQTNLLIGGWDEAAGASLYFLDYLSALHKMNCAAHGYGGCFVISLLDKEWRPDLTVEQAVALADKCIAEVRSRLVVAPPNYVMKIVDKDGARVLVERKSAEVDNSS